MSEVLPKEFSVVRQIAQRAVRLKGPSGDISIQLLAPHQTLRRASQGRFKSSAAKAHYMAHHLSALGIGTPKVLAFADSIRDTAQRYSWLVCEYEPGPSLAILRDRNLITTPKIRQRCIQQVAHLLAKLHHHRLAPAPLDPQNILIGPEDEGKLTSLEYLDHLKRSISATDNLTQLARGVGIEHLTLSNSVRFLRAYVGRHPDAQAHRAALIKSVWESIRDERLLHSDFVEEEDTQPS